MKTDTPDIDRQVAFKNTDQPSFVVLQLKGQRWRWPIGGLTESFFNPAVFVAGAGGVTTQVQELVISVGLRRVTIRGMNLETIRDVIDQGGGALVVEQGAHFRPLAAKSDTYIDEIIVAAGDDSLPGAPLPA